MRLKEGHLKHIMQILADYLLLKKIKNILLCLMEIIKIIILDVLYVTLIRAMAILHMENIGIPILVHIMQVVVFKIWK